MKMTLKKTGLVLILTLFAYSGMTQKNKVTSAALEHQKVKKDHLIEQGKFDKAFGVLNLAKKLIDEAEIWYINNKNAEGFDKMYLVRGKVYYSLAIVAPRSTVADEVLSLVPGYFDISIESFSKGYKIGKKYKWDFTDAAREAASWMNYAADEMYKKNSLEASGEMYKMTYRYLNTVEILDSGAVFNAGLCFQNTNNFQEAAEMFEILANANYRATKGAVLASYCYSKVGKYDKARALLNKSLMFYPNNPDLLIELVNVSLAEGNYQKAMKAINEALKISPNNPTLLYSLGTIHMSLENFKEAETYLRRSMELDPYNSNTLYQLGALLYNWSINLSEEAQMLEEGDPKLATINNTADVKMKDAIKILEKYLEGFPNDKNVLGTLYQAHHMQGNTEKSKKYKARWEAL